MEVISRFIARYRAATVSVRHPVKASAQRTKRDGKVISQAAKLASLIRQVVLHRHALVPRTTRGTRGCQSTHNKLAVLSIFPCIVSLISKAIRPRLNYGIVPARISVKSQQHIKPSIDEAATNPSAQKRECRWWYRRDALPARQSDARF